MTLRIRQATGLRSLAKASHPSRSCLQRDRAAARERVHHQGRVFTVRGSDESPARVQPGPLRAVVPVGEVRDELQQPAPELRVALAAAAPDRRQHLARRVLERLGAVAVAGVRQQERQKNAPARRRGAGAPTTDAGSRDGRGGSTSRVPRAARPRQSESPPPRGACTPGGSSVHSLVRSPPSPRCHGLRHRIDVHPVVLHLGDLVPREAGGVPDRLPENGIARATGHTRRASSSLAGPRRRGARSG